MLRFLTYDDMFAKRLPARKYDIPYVVPQLEAAVLKLGQGSVSGARRVAVCGVGEQWFRGQGCQYLHCIIFPVGSDVYIGAGFQPGREQADEGRLQQAPLMM